MLPTLMSDNVGVLLEKHRITCLSDLADKADVAYKDACAIWLRRMPFSVLKSTDSVETSFQQQ